MLFFVRLVVEKEAISFFKRDNWRGKLNAMKEC